MFNGISIKTVHEKKLRYSSSMFALLFLKGIMYIQNGTSPCQQHYSAINCVQFGSAMLNYEVSYQLQVSAECTALQESLD